MNNLARNKTLWILIAALTLAAAVLGAAVPHFYDKVIAAEFIPAGYAQDLLTIAVCIALLVIVILTGERDLVKQVIVLGVIGSFFYLYGIFVIERVYNPAYYIYLAIFSLSFWALVSGISSVRADLVRSVHVPPVVRAVSAGFSIFVAAVFSVVWIVQLFPLVSAGRKIEYLYSIYVLDLCFVMPAFVILAVMMLRKRGLGILLAPALFILGIFVIFPLGLGEIAKPFFGMAANIASLVASFALTAAFVVLSIIHLRTMKAG